LSRWLLVAAAFALYAPCLTAPVYLDDGPYVFGSAFLRAPASAFWSLLLSTRYFEATGERTWQPMVTVINRLLVDAPVLLRSLSVLLHVLCASLLARLGGRAAGLLFLVFPLAAEAVFFAAFKGHLLAAAAVLASLLAWRDGRRGLSAGLLGAGLLAKETALAAGPLLFLHDVLVERRRAAESLRRLAPHAALAAVYLVWRFAVLAPPPDMLVPAAPRPLAALAWYLGALVWTPGPGSFRVFPEGDAWVFLLLAPYAALLWWKRREPGALFHLLWVPAALLPFLQLVPFAGKSPVADRYLYLAAAGACRGLTRIEGRRATLALAALGVLWAGATLRRTVLFRDPVALADAGAKAAPTSAAAHLFRAQVSMERGFATKAAEAAAAAAGLEPLDPQNWTWLGVARVAAKLPGAEDAFQSALALQETPQARANLGAFYEESGKPALALEQYDRAAELAPDWEKPRRLAAELRARSKRRL
jgi:tetratricopeptide (TPR) repeat protein